MALIPADLLYADTVIDPATRLAHKLGNPPPPDPEPAHRHAVRQVDKWAAACHPAGDLYPPVSAYTATQHDTIACPAPQCFGPAPTDAGAS